MTYHLACFSPTVTTMGAIVECGLHEIEMTHDDLAHWASVLRSFRLKHYVGGTNVISKDDFLRRERRSQKEELRTLRVLRFHRSDNARKDIGDILAQGSDYDRPHYRPCHSFDEIDALEAAAGFVYIRSKH